LAKPCCNTRNGRDQSIVSSPKLEAGGYRITDYCCGTSLRFSDPRQVLKRQHTLQLRQLSSAQTIKARDEIVAKNNKIDRLKAAFELKGENTVRRRDYLYDTNSEGNPVGHPYCPRCEQVDGRMIKIVRDEGALGSEICPQCKSKYKHVEVFG
jgi:hypothetical protein